MMKLKRNRDKSWEIKPTPIQIASNKKSVMTSGPFLTKYLTEKDQGISTMESSISDSGNNLSHEELHSSLTKKTML